MIRWLKWKIAGRELAELERWQAAAGNAARWMSEFPDATAAIQHIRRVASGEESTFETPRIREAMRARRDFRSPISQNEWTFIRQPMFTRQPTLGEIRDFLHTPPPKKTESGMPRESGIDYRFLGMTGEESD